MNKLWSGVETELELYIPQFAGESQNIWPIITKQWKSNYTLGIKSKNDASINFLFVPNNKGKIDEPILGRGTFTAVYELKNEHDKTDLTKYILRIYERDLNISSKHMNYNEKIKYEYENYTKYMLKLYYYGELKIVDEKFDYLKNDTYKFIPGTQKKYNFDYVITKVYNTPVFDKKYNLIGLSNIQKFSFLFNNVNMLNNLAKNNSFHADYKIGNVGWEFDADMNVILIDYDISTIQKLDKLNHQIKVNNGYVTGIEYPSTYIPEYLKMGKGIKSIPVEQYIKYSIGGLNNIIKVLNIEFTDEQIVLPPNITRSQKITKLITNDLGKSLNLSSPNYDDIPDYDEIITILGWLFINKKIK